MSRIRTLVSVSALSLVVGLAVSPAAAGPAPVAQAQARKPVANAAKMDRAAFEALSDDDLLEVNGKSMSKRDALRDAKALRENASKASRNEKSDRDDFEDARATHEKKQKAATDAENAPVLAKMSELKASRGASTPSALPLSGVVSLVGTTAPAAATTTPALNGMLGQLKPGSAVILFGSNFGTIEGEVRMYGTFPEGYVKLSVDSWGNGGIGVFVPTTIKGVLDQQVTLKIVTKAGASSNYKTAPFTAAREIRKMKMADFVTKKECRDAALSSDTCTTVGQSGCTSSVCGDHAMYVLGAAYSTDRWATTLKNTWTYDSHSWTPSVAFTPGPQEWINPVILLETYLLGNANPKLKVISTGAAPSFEAEWGTSSMWSDRYKLNVYVTGPAGVPHV